MPNDQPRTASVIGFRMIVATTLVPAFAQYDSVALSDNPLFDCRLGKSAPPTAINAGLLRDGTYHGEITLEKPGLILHKDTSFFSNVVTIKGDLNNAGGTISPGGTSGSPRRRFPNRPVSFYSRPVFCCSELSRNNSSYLADCNS